jgi:hypothetical protein
LCRIISNLASGSYPIRYGADTPRFGETNRRFAQIFARR